MTTRSLARAALLSSVFLGALVFANSAFGQSDPDHPVQMTTSEISGKWKRAEAFSHFYSFVAGPGEVKVSFYFVSSQNSINVGGQLFGENGRAFDELNAVETNAVQPSYDFIWGMADPTARLVGRFNVPKRQKLVIRVYDGPGVFDWTDPGTYKISVQGGNPSFEGETVRPEPEPSASNGGSNTGRPFTFAQILTGLQSVGTTPETKTLGGRNKFIVKQVLQYKIAFAMNDEREKDLRAAGATDELVSTLKALSAVQK